MIILSLNLNISNIKLNKTLMNLKNFLSLEEYACCFKQRLAEGYSLIHSPRRVLTNADNRSEALVSFFGDNKGITEENGINLFKEQLFSELISQGIVFCHPKSKKYVSILRIVPINQFLILIPFRAFNDPPVYIGADSLTFFRNIKYFSKPKNVLDLATGSGFQLFGLPWQGNDTSMIGLDINPNAILTAQLNTLLNETPWITFKEQDITLNLQNLNQKFDLIIGNPPIIPTPEIISTRLKGMVHADGGKDGFKIVRKLIPNAINVLNDNGSLQLILSSLGNEYPSIISELQEILNKENLSGQIVILKKIPVELDSYYRGQRDYNEYQRWMKFYKEEGYNNWFRSIIRLYKSKNKTKLVYKNLIRSDMDLPPNKERITLDSIKNRLGFYLQDTTMQKNSRQDVIEASNIIETELNKTKVLNWSIRNYGKLLAEKFPSIFKTEGAAIRFWAQCTNEFWWKPKYLERVLW